MKPFIVAYLLAFLPFHAWCTDDTPTKWAAVTPVFEQLIAERNIPGLAAAIVEDGEIVWLLEHGYAESNREVPVTLDTPFWVASVTKPFVALTYLHLANENKIELTEKAADTPDFNKLCTWLASTSIPFAKGLDCSEAITLNHILQHQANFEPGTRFMYNPILYSRLSRHLEHRFGKGVGSVEGRHNTLAKMIDGYILRPAGMTDTMSSMWDPSKARVYQRMADGFAVSSNGNWTKLAQPDKHIAGGAGVVSTVRDLAKFEKALVNKHITNAEIEKQLYQQPTLANGEPAPYGYGWFFEQFRQTTLMWHSGWDEENGYSAMFLRVPDQNLALIILANSEGVWWGNSLTKAEIHTSAFAQPFLNLL